MNLDTLSTKQLNELERLTRELLVAMRKSKLQEEPIVASLQEMESEIGKIRRTRFDAANPEYHSY